MHSQKLGEEHDNTNLMKFNLLVVITALLFAVNVNAQENHFGFKAGLNGYTVRNGEIMAIGPKLGFHVGVLSHIHLSEHFAFQPEVVFSTQGTYYDYDSARRTASMQLNYVNVPLLVQYMFDKGFRVQFGPQLGVLMSAKSTFDGTKTDIRENLTAFDVGLCAGASYVHLKSSFGFDARFNMGVSKINKNGKSSYNQGIQLGVFYLLGHKG